MNKAFEEIIEKLEELKSEKEIGSHKSMIKEAQEIVKKVAEEYDYDDWILCSEKMPEEYEIKSTTKYGDLYKISNNVETTVEFSNGLRTTRILHTIDGKWSIRSHDEFRVIAWKPLVPNPYKGAICNESIK